MVEERQSAALSRASFSLFTKRSGAAAGSRSLYPATPPSEKANHRRSATIAKIEDTNIYAPKESPGGNYRAFNRERSTFHPKWLEKPYPQYFTSEPPQERTKVDRYFEGRMKEGAYVRAADGAALPESVRRECKLSGVTDQVIPGMRGQGRIEREEEEEGRDTALTGSNEHWGALDSHGWLSCEMDITGMCLAGPPSSRGN
ncbi:unnamed protein product [Pleuronectes platessa]|uniref:Uncharacterized protein n=1 Tax=Pleuronectes platessa TaxID=8262 RepID=A0A9N7Z7E6_PLEPL|nr:unnamed protein product [Pleuronectes platessa]